MKHMAKAKKEINLKDDTFTKNQILNSKKFKTYKDALNVILNENKQYTISQVEMLLTEFMKGKVN